LDAAHQAPDIPTRFKLAAEAESILIEEAPIIPIAFPRHNIMVHPAIRGWQNNSAMINYYQFIDLVPIK
jgi:oligopeptide transport system substrate-binding protein